MYRYSVRGRLRACMAACLFERLQGCACVFKIYIVLLDDISYFFGQPSVGVSRKRRCDRNITKSTRSPDGLRYEGDGKRRRGRACTYETQSCPSVKHFASGCMQSLGQFKTLPKPGTNHYITTHSDDRHIWSPYCSNPPFTLPLDDSSGPTLKQHTLRIIAILVSRGLLSSDLF